MAIKIKFKTDASRSIRAIKRLAKDLVTNKRLEAGMREAHDAIIKKNVITRLVTTSTRDPQRTDAPSSNADIVEIAESIYSDVEIKGMQIIGGTADPEFMDKHDPLINTGGSEPLWRILEYGTGLYGKKGAKYPIVNRNPAKRLKFYWKLKKRIAIPYRVMHPGQKGRKYISQGFQDSKPEVEEFLRERFYKFIKRYSYR